MNARADVFGRARQRLEIDMGGDVGLARILQGIGKAVAGDRLEGIAGVAAQMAVIDDQRRAVLVAARAWRSSSSRYRAAIRTRRRQGPRAPAAAATPRSAASDRPSAPNTSLPSASSLTTRSCQPVSRLTT